MLLGCDIRSRGLRRVRVLFTVAGGIAMFLLGEEDICFGISIGDERRYQPPAILLSKLDAGDRELSVQQGFYISPTGLILSECSYLAKPDDAQVLVLIMNHAVCGESGEAAGQLGLD